VILVPVTGGTFDKEYNGSLPPGTHIAIHGRCFSWNGVRKNRETGMFEPC